MLEAAKQLAEAGKRVCVIAASIKDANRLRGLCNDDRIKFTAARNFDWDTQLLYEEAGDDQREYLIDHWAIEQEFQTILAMYHRFDA